MVPEPSLANAYLAPHVALLAQSYARWTGAELPLPGADELDRGRALYHAPFVVVSHGTEPDPIFNYGNLQAQHLFAMTWSELTRLPSRCSAEPLERAEREGLMAAVRQRGYIDDYRGVRVSARGHRFLIERATVWNVVDGHGRLHGQAARFDQWTPLDDGGSAGRSDPT